MTETVTAFDMAGLPVVQAIFDVSLQVTILPSAGTNVKIGLFIPAFDPFTIH